VFSFRVDGHLNGVRIRHNFKTQEEAAAEKSALELKALQIISNLRSVTTCLTEGPRVARLRLPRETALIPPTLPSRPCVGET
jgi:hypothetical protein